MILDNIWPWSTFKSIREDRDEALAIAAFYEADRKNLVKQLRDQDQALWAMSQQPEWSQMQPIFAELMLAVNLRMSDENKRISSMMVDEMHQTYGHNAPPAVPTLPINQPISSDNTNIIRRF